jgi:hypothetical protein
MTPAIADQGNDANAPIATIGQHGAIAIIATRRNHKRCVMIGAYLYKGRH